MQELFIITPVVEPSRLAALYAGMEHPEMDILVHWMVIFDAQHVKYYQGWKDAFHYGQVDNIAVHCILSDKVNPLDKSNFNRNIALDALEMDCIPRKKECWVYQLDDHESLPGDFFLFFHTMNEQLKNINLLLTSFHEKYAFRLKLISGGLRYSDKPGEFYARLVNRAGLTIDTKSFKYSVA